MRPKFVLMLVFFTVLVLTMAFYLKQNFLQRQPAAPEKPAVLPLPAAKSDLGETPNSASRFVPETFPAMPMTPEQKLAVIEEETGRLQGWSTQDDPASLSAILNDLTNSEKEVRLAAIEATKQFGSPDAIPALKAQVADAPDADEQIALIQAADFLSLPTIADSDVHVPLTSDQIQAGQQARQKAAARRQFLMQKHAQNQNASPATGQNSQPPQ